MNDHQPFRDDEAATLATPTTPSPIESPSASTASAANSDAGVADDAVSATHASQEAPLATPITAKAFSEATATSANSDAGDARTTASGATATPAAVVDHRIFNLTIPQAQALFAEHNRRVPAARTIQNYCAEGWVAGEKVPTASGAEWLINDASLLAFIRSKPEVTQTSAPDPVTTEPVAEPEGPPVEAVAPPAAVEPEADSVAPVGETRTVAQMLVENARLSAELDMTRQVIAGKDETIAELKSDREFLREEIKDKRRLNQDLKDITSQVLELLDNMVESRNPQLRMPETEPKPPEAAPAARDAQFTEPPATSPRPSAPSSFN